MPATINDPSTYPDTVDACRAERMRIIAYMGFAAEYTEPEEILDKLQTATTRIFGLKMHERLLRPGSHFQA